MAKLIQIFLTQIIEIWVSQILIILDSNINHSLEVIFIISEETNMIGLEKNGFK